MSEEFLDGEDQQNESKEQDTQYVEEARLQGWVPKEEFRGSEDDWIDAETFVRRGKEINPILKKNNERLLRELEQTKRQMNEFRTAAEEFKQFQKDHYERKTVELETEIRMLREKKKEAISSGDGELAVQIDDRIDELKEEKASTKYTEPTPKETQQQMAPEVEAWVSRNPWYAQNARLAQITNVIAEELRQTKPWLSGDTFFQELDLALEETIPAEKMGRGRNRSPVEGASRNNTSPSGGKKAYDSLPPEAKQACDMFVKQGLMTREEYLKQYFE